MPRARALVEWSFAVDFTNCPRWFSEADFPHLCEAFCPKFLPPSVIQGILLVNLAKLSVNYSIATTYYCNWMLKNTCIACIGKYMYCHNWVWIKYMYQPGVWRLCFPTVAKLSDYGVSFHQKCPITPKRVIYRFRWWSIMFVNRMRNFEHLETRCRTIAAHELAIKSNL